MSIKTTIQGLNEEGKKERSESLCADSSLTANLDINYIGSRTAPNLGRSVQELVLQQAPVGP